MSEVGLITPFRTTGLAIPIRRASITRSSALDAGNSSTTGSYNTYVGDRAAVNNIGSYNTYLGYEAGQDQSAESNVMRLGARDKTVATYIAGVLRHNRIQWVFRCLSARRHGSER